MMEQFYVILYNKKSNNLKRLGILWLPVERLSRSLIVDCAPTEDIERILCFIGANPRWKLGGHNICLFIYIFQTQCSLLSYNLSSCWHSNWQLQNAPTLFSVIWWLLGLAWDIILLVVGINFISHFPAISIAKDGSNIAGSCIMYPWSIVASSEKLQR